MQGLELPDIPPGLKSIQPYLKIANEHDQRDPVVSYWTRLYAVQTGMKLSSKGPEERNFLLKVMDWLETSKKEHHDNEAISNEIAGQAHLENWALKLFLFADKNDRAGNFTKNVIQSFYTAGLLYDVLTTFGELTEEAAQNRKYAKWKAAYIHNCLKNGESPVPGPVDSETSDSQTQKPDADLDNSDDENESEVVDNTEHPEGKGGAVTDAKNDLEPEEGQSIEPTPPATAESYGLPSPPGVVEPTSAPRPALPSVFQSDGSNPTTPLPSNPSSTPNVNVSYTDNSVKANASGIALTQDQMTKVSKYIKWAGSAVNYDDVPTAIENLQKALHLLMTGQDA